MNFNIGGEFTRVKQTREDRVFTEHMVESDDIRLMPVDEEDPRSVLVEVNFGKMTTPVTTMWDWSMFREVWDGTEMPLFSFDQAVEDRG